MYFIGRAGRYGTQWENGYVTTFNKRDLEILQQLLSQSPEQLVQAGLHPTAEQIELFAYHLPSASLSNLLVIFSPFGKHFLFNANFILYSSF